MQPVKGCLRPAARMMLMVYRKDVVINQYITVALQRAHYELLENAEGFHGSILELTGVWAQADTLEEVQVNIREAIELYVETLAPEERRKLLSREVTTMMMEVQVA